MNLILIEKLVERIENVPWIMMSSKIKSRYIETVQGTYHGCLSGAHRVLENGEHL